MPTYPVPAWFDADHYFSSKLQQMQDGQLWGSSKDGVLLQKAFFDSGYSLDADGYYRHFVEYGNKENVSPSKFFDTTEYLKNKTTQVYGVAEPSEAQMKAVSSQIADAGMSLWDHYSRYGWKEGIDPSSSFSTEDYLKDKLSLLDDSWTMDSLKQTVVDSGLSPITHYELYGKDEGLLYRGKLPQIEVCFPDPADPVLSMQILDVDDAQANGQPLLDNPITGLNIVFKPNYRDDVTQTLSLEFREEDAALYKGASATYETLKTAFEHALSDLPEFADLFSVSLGGSFTKSIAGYSSDMGREIQITHVTNWDNGIGEIVSADFVTANGSSLSEGNMQISQRTHINFPLSEEFQVTSAPFTFSSGDKIDLRCWFTGAISAAGTGAEFLQDNGISIRALKSPHEDKAFTINDALALVSELAAVKPYTDSVLVLRDDATHTFFAVDNDAAIGVRAEEITLLGTITTDGYAIGAGDFTAASPVYYVACPTI